MGELMMEGGCFCGAVRYQVDGEPGEICHCHCLDCRRSSGAVFVTWVSHGDEEFRFTAGEPATRVHPPEVQRTFCRDCGTSLTFRRTPGEVDITVASMDDPEALPPPRSHVWTLRKFPWLALDDGLPCYRKGRAEGDE
jgi:hypothetical protein